MQHVDEGRLHAYLDGELTDPGDDPHEVERHLDGCPACRARLEGVERLRGEGRAFLAGGDLRRVEQPPFEAVVARSRRAQAGRGASRSLARAAWAASLAVALGAGWLARGLLRDDAVERVATVDGGSVEMAAEADGADGAPAASAAGPVDLGASAPEPVMETRRGAGETAVSAPGAGGTIAARGEPTGPAAVPTAPAAPASAAVDPAPASPAPPVVALESVAAGDARNAVAPPAAPAVAAPPDVAGMQATGGRSSAFAAAPGATAWSPIDAAGAARLLGRPPLTLPESPVLALESGEVAGRAAIRVRQQLPGGGVLTLVQHRTTDAARARVAPAAEAADAGPRAPAARGTDAEVGLVRGGLSITALGPLPADSLRPLLDRLR